VLRKSARRGQYLIIIVMSTNMYGKLGENQFRDEGSKCGKVDAPEDGATLLGEYTEATGHGQAFSRMILPSQRGCSELRLVTETC